MENRYKFTQPTIAHSEVECEDINKLPKKPPDISKTRPQFFLREGYGAKYAVSVGGRYHDLSLHNGGNEPFWLEPAQGFIRSIKSLFAFLAEQPSQLKYIEWPDFQNTVKTATLTLVLVAMLIVVLSSVESGLEVLNLVQEISEQPKLVEKEALRLTEDLNHKTQKVEYLLQELVLQKTSDYKGGLAIQVNAVIKQNNTLLYLAIKQSQKLIELEEKFDKLNQEVHTVIEQEPSKLENSISSLAKRLDNFSISGIKEMTSKRPNILSRSSTQTELPTQEDQIRGYRAMTRSRYQAVRATRRVFRRNNYNLTPESAVDPEIQVEISRERRANLVPTEGDELSDDEITPEKVIILDESSNWDDDERSGAKILVLREELSQNQQDFLDEYLPQWDDQLAIQKQRSESEWENPFAAKRAQIISKHKEQAFPTSTEAESRGSYQPPPDAVMGPSVYLPARQNPQPFYKPDYQFGYPQGKGNTFNGGYGEYHNSQWTLPLTWTKLGVMLVLPADPGLWSEVISIWESITISSLNNQT
ncbi:Orf y [Tanacetum coccineum]